MAGRYLIPGITAIMVLSAAYALWPSHASTRSFAESGGLSEAPIAAQTLLRNASRLKRPMALRSFATPMGTQEISFQRHQKRDAIVVMFNDKYKTCGMHLIWSIRTVGKWAGPIIAILPMKRDVDFSEFNVTVLQRPPFTNRKYHSSSSAYNKFYMLTDSYFRQFQRHDVFGLRWESTGSSGTVV